MSSDLVVYLDSSDFSTLAAARDGSAEARVRNQLIELAGEPTVLFVYSSIHVGEMAPKKIQHSSFAQERIDFMVGLCGENCLVSFDRLLDLELLSLVDLDKPIASPEDMVSRVGDWYPAIGDLVRLIPIINRKAAVNEALKKAGLNRKERRKRAKNFVRHEHFTPLANEILGGQNEEVSMRDVLDKVPIRPEDETIFQRYVLGKASSAEVAAALEKAFRDPSWILRWVKEHPDHLELINNWIREPGRLMHAVISSIAAMSSDGRQLSSILGKDMFSAQEMKKQQDRLVLRITSRFLEDRVDAIRKDWTLDQIDVRCPGLSTMVRVSTSVAWDSFKEKGRSPSRSDFADTAHALYAPYVNIFRSDRYMAPHIKRCVSKQGVDVVSKLGDVPARIAALL